MSADDFWKAECPKRFLRGENFEKRGIFHGGVWGNLGGIVQGGCQDPNAGLQVSPRIAVVIWSTKVNHKQRDRLYRLAYYVL